MSQCFNPCSNGMKKEQWSTGKTLTTMSFNPCSNGMKKELTIPLAYVALYVVLILVLME